MARIRPHSPTPSSGDGPTGGPDSAAQELARSRLTITLNSMLDPYILLRAVRHPSGRIVDVEYLDANAAALSYMRRTREDLIGSRLLERYPAHAFTGLFAEYAHVIETGDPLVLDDFAMSSEITRDGRRFDMRGVRVDDGASVTWRDVTERHEMVEHYRLLAEHASDVVVQTDPEGRIMWVSPSITHELGWSPDDVVGRFLGGVTHPEEDAASDRWLQELEEHGHGTFEVRLLDAAGRYHQFSFTAHNVTDEDGAVTSRVASLRNIDQEVAHREALQTERDLLDAALQAALDPHVLLRAVRDENGTIVDFEITEANAAACEYLRAARQDLIGRRLLELMPGSREAGLFDLCSRAIDTGEPLVLNDVVYTFEMTGVTSHSDVRGIRVGDLLSLTWHDLTGRYEVREQYRLIAENASDVVLIVDQDFRYQWVSPSVTEVLGWRAEDLVGRSLWEFLHPDDHARIRDPDVNPIDGRYGVDDLRWRRADGTYAWMSGRARLIFDEAGRATGRVAALRDTGAEVAAREALRSSEELFQLLAENASDVVYQVDMESTILWISPSVEQVLGKRPEDLLGTRAYDLAAEEDRALIMDRRERVKRGETTDIARIRFRRADGESLWMGLHAHPLRGAGGEVVGAVVAARNRQAEVLAERAATILSAGSQALVHATDEYHLLEETCRIAEEDAGYVFAWYGRKAYDERRSVEIVTSSASHRSYLDEITVTWGDDVHGQGPTGRALRWGHTVITKDFRLDDHFSPWLAAALDHGFRSSAVLPVWIGDEIDGSLQVYASEPDAFDDSSVAALENLTAELGFGLKRLRDRDELARSRADQALLINAIDQAGDGIVITDPSSTILYANPATVRTSGYSLDEILGGNPRIFQSGLHDPEFYAAMWAELSLGRAWHGVLFNKRKSGDLYEEDVSISPIRNDQGALVAYVAVKHDLSTERKLEADLSREQEDRLTIVEVMNQIDEAGSIEAVADRFCRGLTSLSDIDVALVLINGTGGMVPVAISGASLDEMGGGAPILPDHAGSLFELSTGPMKIDLTPENWPVNSGLVAQAVRDGVRAVVLVPIRWRGDMVGVLGLATKDPEAATLVESRYPYFEELGAYAGTLLGRLALDFEHADEVRARITGVIERREFHPVFQPIVDLVTNEVVGYEALTRFDDGCRPDQRFEEAATVDLGSRLECACVEAALEAARDLPAGRFVDVNFSPATLLDGSAAEVFRRAAPPTPPRQINIEITEHAPIDDYAAVRRAVDQCDSCLLVVDDAGEGYATLSHIIELRPHYVKIDISLVRDIDTDQARQAMVAGLFHYAARSGTTMVAEGVESAGEAATLRVLGASLGTGRMLAQGFFFGRPAPAL